MEGDGAEAVEGAPVLVLDGYGSEEEAVAAAEAAEALDAAGGDEATAAADEEVDDADLMSGLGAMLGGYGSGEEEEAEGQAADGAATEEGPGAEGGAAEVAAPPEEAEEDQPAEPTQKDEEEADDDYDPFAGGAAEEEPEEDGDGLETGTTVTITGLASAAGQKFNGCRGVLGPFDAASGRWQVRLSDGAGIKALKPENLVPDKPEAAELPEEECDKSDEDDDEYEPFGDVDAEVPDSVWEEEEGEDAYATWDSNEIAAAVVQAEIMGDTEKAARLGAVLRQRRKEKCGDAVDEGDIVEEVVEVPDEAVGFVIGRGGENIQRLSSESGARLTLGRGRAGEDTKARRCVVRGSAKQVAAARKLLQEAIAQGAAIAESKGKGKGKGKGKELFGKGAGGQAGVCKWYAAGFCRNRTGPDGMCRNGLHCSEAARKAEEDWIAAGGPQATPGPPAAKDPPLLLLLDLEGGGNKDGRDGEDEIIEVPVLSMCAKTGREFGRFHRFARPGYWDREFRSMRRRFPAECFNDGSSAVPFPEVIRDLLSWVRALQGLKESEELRPDSFLFVTCGNWDVKTAIPRQCSNPMPGMVDFAVQKLLFSRWSNLKEVFRDHFQLSQASAPTGMRGMLNRLRIPLYGQHHLGMDDVSNLSKILKHLIKDGCNVQPTGRATNLKPPPKGMPKGKGFGKDVGKDFGKAFGKGPAPVMQPPPSFGGCGGPGLKGGKFDKSFGGKGKGKGKGKGWGPGVGFVPGGCLGFAPAGGGGGCSGGTSNSFSKASGGAPRVDGAPAPLLVPPPGGAPHPGAPPTSGPFNQMGIAGVAPAKRRAPQSSGDDPAKRVRGDAGLAGFFGTAPLPGERWNADDEGSAVGAPAEASPAEPAGACTPRGLLSSLPAPFDVEYDEFGEPVSGGVGDGAAEAEAGAAGAAGETGPEDVGVEAAGDEAAGDEAAADEGAGAAEGDEHEGEESCEAPPPKTPRIASLLAGLPAPVAGAGD